MKIVADDIKNVLTIKWSRLQPISKKSKQNHSATKLKHTEEILCMVFVANNQSPVIWKPSKQELDFPSTPN